MTLNDDEYELSIGKISYAVSDERYEQFMLPFSTKLFDSPRDACFVHASSRPTNSSTKHLFADRPNDRPSLTGNLECSPTVRRQRRPHPNDT